MNVNGAGGQINQGDRVARDDLEGAVGPPIELNVSVEEMAIIEITAINVGFDLPGTAERRLKI